MKRPLLLADIALELSRYRRDFRFVVAGHGPEATRLKSRVHAHGLDDLFNFLGRLSDVAPELKACDVVVLPSKTEGVPLIALEAMAASRPVVASAVGDIPYVVTPGYRYPYTARRK